MPWFWFLNTWVIAASDCRLIPLSLYATRWPMFPKCMQLTLVSWYVASMLCCHSWMFSMMESYPCKIWVLSQCGITYLFSFLPIYEDMTMIHSCGMFSFLVECGLVHRGDCINCETCYFCFDPAFVRPNFGRADFQSACTWTGRWCALVVAISSLSLFTIRADRRSQISSLDSCCATRVSKTDMLC